MACVHALLIRRKVRWAAAAIFQKYRGTELGEVVETLSGKVYLRVARCALPARYCSILI